LELNLNMSSNDNDLAHIRAQSYGVRAGYYSAAFLLQRTLADKLDIDPTEIEIADISKKPLNDATDRFIAQIILTDELPNGSGFVRHLYDNFENILSETINPKPRQPKEGLSYLEKIHSPSHQDTCKDACYECLKVYRNMNYHSLLDWRLGLALLRIMNDSEFVCGADGEFSKYPELNGWDNNTKVLRDRFAQSFFYDTNVLCEEIYGLPVIKWRKEKNIIAFVHPFWNVSNLNYEDNWLAYAMTEIRQFTAGSGGSLSIIDTFNLHRRPGWCYEKLINR
jgi:DEAD/DEAH box helicase domain-containing protein